MAKQQYSPEERKERYDGYYWLILHTDPVHAPDGGHGDNGCIIPRKYWRGENPDWVKTNYPDTDINTWFAPEGIPLFQVGNTEIKDWRDMKILWGDVKIKGTANCFYDRTPPGKAKQSPTTLLDEAELWLNLRPNSTSDDFYRLCGDEILQAIESYLKPQHKKNLKKLGTPLQPGQGEVKDKETSSPQTTAPWDWKWLIDKIFEVIKLFNWLFNRQ